MASPQGWRLEVLGKPRLVTPDGRALRCQGSTLAFLTYLALEGPTKRAQLARRLWPDTPDSAARNNLVHLLRRTERNYGVPLRLEQDLAALGDEVTVDVHALLDGETTPPPGGELLEGVHFDDRPDLEDWLAVWRERLAARRADRLTEAAQRHEEAGEFAQAVTLTEALLNLNPVSEDASRRLMRLHYLRGDRGSALATFERCRAVLRREFGTEPLPETLDLAREVERGAALPAAPRPRTRRLPLSVLRPPVLVGREDAWARMEAAWTAGQFIILVGEPGVGKSRLAQEFAATKGEVLLLEGRPGDVVAPYSTTARDLRRILARVADLPLAPWVRRSLAPLLPELAGEGVPPSEPDLRLHAAVAHLFQEGLRGISASVYDDLHLADAASIEAGLMLISSSFPLGQPGGVPHLICTVRAGEVPESTADVFRRAVAAGQAVQIDLDPLDAAQVGELVRGLGVPEVEALGPRLAQFAGGNPLFVLETVKHLLEQPPTADRAERALPVTARVGQLIAQRLSRLSPSALNVARAAAVLGGDLRVELVAEVLGTPLLDTAGAWEELEAAHIMTGERFSHDLVADTVLAGLPGVVRRLLHRSAARALARTGEGAARVARHWLEGGGSREAAPFFLLAARDALAALRPLEALRFYAQAAALYDELGDGDAAFEARASAVERVWWHEGAQELGTLGDRLLQDARTPEQVARAQAAQAGRLLSLHRPAQAQAAAERGLEALGPAGHLRWRAALLRELVNALAQQGEVSRTLAASEEAAALHAQLDEPLGRAQGAQALGAALLRLERLEEAAAQFTAAIQAFEALPNPYSAAWAKHALATTLEAAGSFGQAAALREKLEAHLRTEPHAPTLRRVNLVQLGTLSTRARAYRQALTWLNRARTYGEQVGEPAGALHRAFADVYWALAAHDACDAAVESALSSPDDRDGGRNLPWLLRGLVLSRRGQLHEAAGAFDRVEGALRERSFTYTRGRLLLARADMAPPPDALNLAAEALVLARSAGHADLETAALTARAEAQLNLGRADDALRDSALAVARLPEAAPRDDYARPLLVHHQVLSALGCPGAGEPLREALRWLEEALAHVPEEYRNAFLNDHPTHRTLRTLRDEQNGHPAR